MAGLYDFFFHDFVYDYSVELAAGTQLDAGKTWIPPVIETDTDTVLEAYRIELFPPTTGLGAIQDMEYIQPTIYGKEYQEVHIDELLMPPVNEASPVVGVDIGVPLLSARGLGYVPNVIESACPKVGPRQNFGLNVKAVVNITEDFIVRVHFMRVRTEAMLRKILGTAVTQNVTMQNIETGESQLFAKNPIPVSLATFTGLSGGLAQDYPKIYPWITYAKNKAATTVNTPYGFDYPSYVNNQYEDLDWNLDEKEARVVTHLGVTPHANSLKTRFSVEGREKNEWFTTGQYDNSLPVPLNAAGTTVYQGLQKLRMPYQAWNQKARVEHQDNGTSIAANGVAIYVKGYYLDLA